MNCHCHLTISKRLGNLSLLLFIALAPLACDNRKAGVAVDPNKKEQAIDPADPNGINGDAITSNPNDNPLASDIIAEELQPADSIPPAAEPCRDRNGQTIAGQYVDQAQNTASTIVDCYDASNQFVYGGTTTDASLNCYQDLTQRYGADIIYPAQNLLPNLYNQAYAQGTNAQQTLIKLLSAASCDVLKQQGG